MSGHRISWPAAAVRLALAAALALAALVGGWWAPAIASLRLAYVVAVVVAASTRQRGPTHAVAGLGSSFVLIQAALLPTLTPWVMLDALLSLVAIWLSAIASLRFFTAADASGAVAAAPPAAKDNELLGRLRMMTKNAGLWLWEAGPDGKGIWDTNRPPDLALEGLTTQQAFERFSDYIEPDDLKIIHQDFQRAIAANEGFITQRYRLRTPGGDLRHFQLQAELLYDTGRRLVRMTGITADITREIARAEQFAVKAEHEHILNERMRSAAEAADLWIWERDPRSGEFIWDENRPSGLGLEDVPYGELWSQFQQQILDEDLALVRSEIVGAIKQVKASSSIRYRTRGLSGFLRHRHSETRIFYDERGRPTRLLGITRDVTNEVQTTLMLQRQAKQERTLLDRLSIAAQAAGVHCWEFQLSSEVFTWSENAVAEFGPDARGMDLVELTKLHKQTIDIDEVRQLIRNSMPAERHDAIHSFEFRRTMPDGSKRHMRVFQHHFYDGNGNPTHAIGASIDITEEIARTEQLRDQARQLEDAQRRLERASESSQEGHWEIDLQTMKHWASNSYRSILGYAAAFELGTVEAWRGIVHPDDYPTMLINPTRIKSTGSLFDNSMRMRHANGEWRWMRVRGRIDCGADGKPQRISGSVWDCHQQVLAEEELRQARERFERAIRGTQDGLWEGQLGNGSRMWVSPRYAEIMGCTVDELQGIPGPELEERFVHPDDVENVRATRERAAATDQPYIIEHRMRRQDGTWIWVQTRATIEKDADGTPLRISGSMQDVTAAHRAREELIKATEEAQAANRAKSAFLANVSHEIRTPMNGIIGMTGLLLETKLDRTQFEYADTVRSSADALLTVINDILDFSKIEAGKLDIESIEVDLRGNVEDVGAMLGFTAAAKQLELVVNVRPDVPARVLGDPQRIRQCLINLVGNAIKFTRKGEIVIEVCTVGRQDGKALMHFEVRDTGIGIAPNTLKTLFNPFVQADSSTTRQYGGTGLGLSIVKRLADMMSGQVGVESVVGKGSTFWMNLPLEEVEVKDPPLDDVRVSGKRVLVVDDNDTNRRVLAEQLMHAGYEVELAPSGALALTLMRQALGDNRPFDVVLVDFQMPDMDGATLGEHINSDPHFSRSRVVVLTSMDRHGDIHRFAALGFAAYLTKPIRARELFACLDRVLAREAREWHMQSQPLITRSALREQTAGTRFEGHVLLVEDNAVNQKVAQRFVERLGCMVTIVNDGAEAVDTFKVGKFDLVLMDLQMPVMDGFTATRHIRDFEAWRPRTPIVALTANAMSGQMDRCLAAGMDGFLTKPIEVERLREVLRKYCGAERRQIGEAAVDNLLSSRHNATPHVDFQKLHEVTGGDGEFAQELVTAYLESARRTYAELLECARRSELQSLGKAAHKLKGASANIYAESIRALCAELEGATAENVLPPGRVEELGRLIDATAKVLDEFLQRSKPAA